MPICGIRGIWFKIHSDGSRHLLIHDDVIKLKHIPRYWPFVPEIHRSPVNSPQKGQWRGALMFSLICAWLNGWVNNREAGDLRRHRAHYDVILTHVYRSGERVWTPEDHADMYKNPGQAYWYTLVLCHHQLVLLHWPNVHRTCAHA